MTLSSYKVGEDILSGRVELWKQAISLFVEHPILGIGWGGFANSVSESYRSVHGQVYNAHNIYLQFLAETGIIGTLIIVSCLVWLFIHGIRQAVILKNNEELSHLRRLNVIALGIQAYFLILGMIDPCFMKYYFWVFFTISIAFTKYIDETLVIS